MTLHQAMQECLEKIKTNNDSTRYSHDMLEVLRAMQDNQERLAESLAILGTVVTGIIEEDIEIEILPPKGSLSN